MCTKKIIHDSQDTHDQSDEPLAELERLRFENNIFKEVMDNLMEGVYITDEQENIIWMNLPAAVCDGLERDEVIGRPEAEVYKHLGRFNHFTTKTKRPVPFRKALYYLPDGRRVDCLLDTKPYFENGRLQAVATIGYDINQIQMIARWAFDLNTGISKNTKTRANRTRFSFNDIVGISQEIKNTIKMAQKASLSNANIMIFGETGTGKELFAQSIHNAGQYADGQFLAVNCSAIPETLFESILFGTAKGAFTGAVDGPGFFELASGGTLFLDEVNSMPLELQAKILRVLQEKEVQRLGEKKMRPINCRIISATNVDPLAAIQANKLREDFYFRLAAITLSVPPLRLRRDDINYFISFYLNTFKRHLSFTINNISSEVLDVFQIYPWPGNVRELEHCLEHALTMLDPTEKCIETSHLTALIRLFVKKLRYRPGSSKQPPPAPSKNFFSNPIPMTEALNKIEFDFIKNALTRNDHMITKAADFLGLSRQALYYRIKRLRSAGYAIDDKENGFDL